MAIKNADIINLAENVRELRLRAHPDRGNDSFKHDLQSLLEDDWTLQLFREKLRTIGEISDQLMDALKQGTTS